MMEAMDLKTRAKEATRKKNMLDRNEITEGLADSLKSLDYIHAFWEAGAVAFGRVDEWSDLDINLVVDDGMIDEAFLSVEKALHLLSPIQQKFEVVHPPDSGIHQAFYRLKNTSEYLLIDLAIFKPCSSDKFLETELHGNPIFYFKKNNLVKTSRFDKNEFGKKVRKRLSRLKSRFNMFNIFVQKEINRGNHIEAADLYQNITLASLTEALRIRHNPVHYNFKTRYIHYELPPETVEKLQSLYFVKDERDLQEKYNKATKWFHKIVSEIAESKIVLR